MSQADVPAAQYVRMSTDHQQYSTDNQAAVIARYAEEHGFRIVQSYADFGLSGVVLRYRTGLRQLLQDVVQMQAQYRAILVYDVSRWGRFQDSDESAHYEYLCKAAGIPVHYCAETFNNDGSLPSSIMKVLKRVMAAEYSRDLSAKVYLGEKNICERGFKVGGAPGYGLRRMLVDLNRAPKQLLGHGERKALATDRVILVPGPEHEVQSVRQVFRLFTVEGMNTSEIAAHLNAKGVEYVGRKRRAWYTTAVYRILTHPKYMGCSVFGQISHKLSGHYSAVPRCLWTITPGAFQPLVDEATFNAVARRLRNRTACKSDADLLEDLRRLLARHGKLTEDIINAARDVASMHAYRARFGSLRQAYARIGYDKLAGNFAQETRRRIGRLRTALIERLCAESAGKLKLQLRNGDRRLRTNVTMPNGKIISVYVCRFRATQFTGSPRWSYQPATYERNNVTLLARLNEANERFMDFHLLRDSGGRFRFLLKDDPLLKDGIRFNSLTEACRIATALSCTRK